LLLPLSLRRDLAAKQTACYHLAPEFTLYGRDGFERLKDVYCTVREQDGNKRIFVRNEGQEDRFATFSLKGVWYAVFLQKGESIVISAELDGDVSVYRPFTDRTERAERSIPPFDYFTRQTGFSLAPRAENILVIDSCKASIGGEVYAGDALFVDRAVHEKIDGGNAESAEVTIVYTFINKGYKGKVKLAMETGEECVLCACNGERLSADGGWFYDRDCKTFPVPILREGENTVELKYRISRSAKKLEQGAFETESNLYFYKTEFENIYLLGDFAVRGERSVFRNKERAYIRLQGEYISPHDTIDKIDKIDKIDTETMPFYRGQLSYRGRFFMQDTKGYERLFLRVKTNAPLYAVSVNGSPKSWVTDGYVEIGEHIRDGENLLEIETYSSERNVMGSFHYFDGDNEYVAPETFAGERGWADNFNRKTPFPLIPERTYTDGKLLLPQGVEDVVELLGYKRK
jgi:hypothetical protein